MRAISFEIESVLVFMALARNYLDCPYWKENTVIENNKRQEEERKE